MENFQAQVQSIFPGIAPSPPPQTSSVCFFLLGKTLLSNCPFGLCSARVPAPNGLQTRQTKLFSYLSVKGKQRILWKWENFPNFSNQQNQPCTNTKVRGTFDVGGSNCQRQRVCCNNILELSTAENCNVANVGGEILGG